MKYFYVVGDKSSKSLSPIIFNHWFKKYKIISRYSYIEVKKNNFEKVFLETLKNKKITGFNITIPYKKKVIKHLFKLEKHAKKIEAVNCILKKTKLIGFNTDWLGYGECLKNTRLKKNSKIIIFGYGGASKAIHYYFLTKGFKKIYIFNRTKKAILSKQKRIYTKKYPDADDYISGADLLINTTPTNPITEKQTKLVLNKTVVSDIVYSPKTTRFLSYFPNNKKIYGIDMLINQAILSFEIWFGFKPVVDLSLKKKLDKKIK